MNILEKIGHWIARYLEKESPNYRPTAIVSHQKLKESLQPGDILLVEGNTRISIAIKYLTQSTWSHAALYVGNGLDIDPSGTSKCLIEADMLAGVIAVPLSKYASFNVRICRPVGLSHEDRERLLSYAISKLGMQYDVRNAVDLLRYLLPQPPAPIRWRRKMIALGSGEPTRAICSTLIAGAYLSIDYPILPDISDSATSKEIRHIRNTRLFVPRDFDLSPYFQVIKPLIENCSERRLSSAAEVKIDKRANNRC